MYRKNYGYQPEETIGRFFSYVYSTGIPVMQLNNLRQEHHLQGQPVLWVSALGFGAAIEDKLRQLFETDRPGKQVYALVQATEPGIGILLVNYDNPLALRKKDLLINSLYSGAELVAVSQKPLTDAPMHHIRGMLTPARLMAVLDKIALPAVSMPVSALPQPAVIPPAKLELVQAPARLQDSAASSRSLPVAALSSGNRFRALVVDDSAAIQKSLQLKLATLEQIADIDFADSGEAALAMAEARQYHLIFLDVMMPGLDGYETCARLRKKPEYKKTPIIMVSGKTSPLDEVKGVMAGCTTYLTKPVQDDAFQKLSIRVLAWLTDRKADGQNAH